MKNKNLISFITVLFMITVLTVSSTIIKEKISNFKDSSEYLALNNMLQENSISSEETDASCFVFDENTKTITSYNGITDLCPKDVVTPKSINDVNVEAIGAEAFLNYQLTSIILPNGIITIGEKAFRDNLFTSIIIPNSVISIGDSAFRYNLLAHVTIGNSITSIGKSAFRDNYIEQGNAIINNYVENVTLGTDVFAYNGDNGRKVITPSLLIPTDASCFEFYIPAKTITGYKGIAADCPVNVVIPIRINGIEVKTIGDSAFSNRQLTSVVIPDSVTIIGPYAFRDNQLTSIVIPNSVEHIEMYAFRNNQLTSIVIPDSVEHIGNYAFAYNQLKSATIGASVKVVDQYSFSNNFITQGNATINNNKVNVRLGTGAFNSNGPNGTTTITPIFLRD